MALSYTFDDPGTYEILLSVTDEIGYSHFANFILTVRDTTTPNVEMTIDNNVKGGDRITLDGSASDDNVGITKWLWTIEKDGTEVSLDGEIVKHTFDEAGDYFVTLTVEDGEGNTRSESSTITVTVDDENPSWWWLLILIMMALVGVILVVSMRRRHPSEAIGSSSKGYREDGPILVNGEARGAGGSIAAGAASDANVLEYSDVDLEVDIERDGKDAGPDVVPEEPLSEHDQCLALLDEVESLVEEVKAMGKDVKVASNLVWLAKSREMAGDYTKATYYAERSRYKLHDILEIIEKDRHYCPHCDGEVSETDETCPHCEKGIESGLMVRTKRDLVAQKDRFYWISRDDDQHNKIAAELKNADNLLTKRSASDALSHIEKARVIMDDMDFSPEDPLDEGDGPVGSPEQEGEPEDTLREDGSPLDTPQEDVGSEDVSGGDTSPGKVSEEEAEPEDALEEDAGPEDAPKG